MAKFTTSNFIKRALSVTILLPLFLLLLLKGSLFLLLVVLFLALGLCWYEWSSLFNFPKFYKFWGIFLLLFIFLANNNFSFFYLMFFLMWGSFIPFMLNFEKQKFKNYFFPFLTGLFYLTLGFIPFLLIFQKYSRELLLLFFCIIFANDTFAYLTGKFLGKTPLVINLSPKKTWEGFFGGIIGALLIGLFLNSLFNLFPIIKALTLILVVSLVSVCGDLFESAVKRAVEKKDSGTLIPGHGGLLDRIDSVLFASPVFLFFLEVLNYGV